jgi:hypothetical protein
MTIHVTSVISGVLALSAFTLAALGQTAQRPCEQLTKFKLTGTELVIAKAETVPVAASLPAYCRVDGTIDPRTGVEANLMELASRSRFPSTGTAVSYSRVAAD